MGSDHTAFDPLDLEIIDHVYEAACAALFARDATLDEPQEIDRQKDLRQRLFAVAEPGSVDFDTLYERVMSTYDARKLTALSPDPQPL